LTVNNQATSGRKQTFRDFRATGWKRPVAAVQVEWKLFINVVL